MYVHWYEIPESLDKIGGLQIRSMGGSYKISRTRRFFTSNVMTKVGMTMLKYHTTESFWVSNVLGFGMWAIHSTIRVEIICLCTSHHKYCITNYERSIGVPCINRWKAWRPFSRQQVTHLSQKELVEVAVFILAKLCVDTGYFQALKKK